MTATRVPWDDTRPSRHYTAVAPVMVATGPTYRSSAHYQQRDPQAEARQRRLRLQSLELGDTGPHANARARRLERMSTELELTRTITDLLTR